MGSLIFKNEIPIEENDLLNCASFFTNICPISIFTKIEQKRNGKAYVKTNERIGKFDSYECGD